MKKRVLDVGQCPPDHASIKRLVESMNGEVRKCVHPDEALEILRKNEYDLVLVNRKIDIDYSDGIELIKAMKSDDKLKEIPVMLITNFPDHQKIALDLGAVPGFGKNDIGMPAAAEKLSFYLS